MWNHRAQREPRARPGPSAPEQAPEPRPHRGPQPRSHSAPRPSRPHLGSLLPLRATGSRHRGTGDPAHRCPLGGSAPAPAPPRPRAWGALTAPPPVTCSVPPPDPDPAHSLPPSGRSPGPRRGSGPDSAAPAAAIERPEAARGRSADGGRAGSAAGRAGPGRAR